MNESTLVTLITLISIGFGVFLMVEVVKSDTQSAVIRAERHEYRLSCFSSGIKEEKTMNERRYYYLNNGGVWYHDDFWGWSEVAPAVIAQSAERR